MLKIFFGLLLLSSQAMAADNSANLSQIKDEFMQCITLAVGNEDKIQSCRKAYFEHRNKVLKKIAQTVHQNEEVERSIERQRLAQQGK